MRGQLCSKYSFHSVRCPPPWTQQNQQIASVIRIPNNIWANHSLSHWLGLSIIRHHTVVASSTCIVHRWALRPEQHTTSHTSLHRQYYRSIPIGRIDGSMCKQHGVIGSTYGIGVPHPCTPIKYHIHTTMDYQICSRLAPMQEASGQRKHGFPSLAMKNFLFPVLL